MKKVLIVVLLIVIIVAVVTLSQKNQVQNSKLTMTDVISKFEENGLEVKINESKPYFQLIGAKDGTMLYVDNEIVKLYEYESEEDYKDALKNYSALENMPYKGLVILDTNYQKVIDIFNSL